MFVNQIAVFLENKKGRVCEFATVLANEGINISVISIADTAEYGILRAITSDNERAVEVLKKNGFNLTATNLIGVEVDNKPGGLQKVLKILDDSDINIGYLYSYAGSSERNKSLILIKVEDPDFALDTLKKNGISVLKESVI